MPPWVAKEKIGTLLLASEMQVPIPRSRTVRWYIFFQLQAAYSSAFDPLLALQLVHCNHVVTVQYDSGTPELMGTILRFAS